jgi:hypothetical protein
MKEAKHSEKNLLAWDMQGYWFQDGKRGLISLESCYIAKSTEKGQPFSI